MKKHNPDELSADGKQDQLVDKATSRSAAIQYVLMIARYAVLSYVVHSCSRRPVCAIPANICHRSPKCTGLGPNVPKPVGFL